MKKRTIQVMIVVGLFIVALLINPIDYYVGYKGEKELFSVSDGILSDAGFHDEEIKAVNHLGSNIFLIETADNHFIIQRERNNRSTSFTVFESSDFMVERLDGLKPSLSLRIKEILGR
ncbi:hypothetical protein [Sutcliffiella rhizosphaerae]|uniref:Uncharacterized protein n=1 Tax=Sutcliffiella rhizosphaerae TaxID=2880967 RepID=A0ABN8ADM9_9BACI|nr:hypothetical protein [Sutcliffiella rhizosphaerae]CAG9621273.1 hypothetical protein BACCIP111883_02045 [Sutcliffiella rhizosphaerae]